jgi:benzoylformate decarboxylase
MSTVREWKPKTGKSVAQRLAPHASGSTKRAEGRLTAAQVFEALNAIRPAHAVLVEESRSNLSDHHAAWPITEPDTFYTFASGGLGWNLPTAVGIALGERDTGRNRPIILIIGDGSFQYSLQSIWTAAQLHLPLLIVVLRNEEYRILKSFAVLEETPGVPGLALGRKRSPEARGETGSRPLTLGKGDKSCPGLWHKS